MAVSTDKLSQAFSLALEDRSSETIDLVSDSNVIFHTLKKKGAFSPYSGPTIQKRVQYAQTGTVKWYSGYEYLDPKPSTLFQNAEWTPKMLAVSPTLSMEEILQNSGKNQIKEIFKSYIDTAQTEMQDEFSRALHSNGTGNGGKEIVGLQGAVPTDPTSGTYGSIARSNTWWQTNEYDADTDFGTTSQVTSTTIRPMFEKIVIETTRGKRGPDLILTSVEHYQAFSASLTAIQRVTDEGMAALGFTGLQFAAPGKMLTLVLEGGIGSNMPSNTTYFLDTKGLEIRYHPDRNFTAFGGKQSPVNQDAVVQHMGWMGEFIVHNPMHQSKFYDSDLAS